MSIRSFQIGRIANDVIEEFLQAGTLPSVDAVIAGIDKKLAGRLEGTPQTVFTPVSFGSPTAPATMNTLTQNISSDIQTLYDDSIDLTNRIIRHFDNTQTLRERLYGRIDRIQASIPTINQTFTDTLSSLKYVDPSSSAWVDLQEGWVGLLPSSSQTQKADLSNATLTYTTTSTISSTIGSLASILSDSVNEAFFVRVSSNTTQASIVFTLTLPTMMLSRLELFAQIGSSMTVQATVGSLALPAATVGLTRRASWDFQAQDVTTVVLTLSKNVPDLTVGGTYYFDFGLKNISLLYEEYLQTATLSSSSIPFNSIGTVSLSTNEVVPTGCFVEWFVGFNGPNGSFGQITPGSPIVVNSIAPTTVKRIFPVRSINSFGRVFDVANDLSTTSDDIGLPVQSPIRGGYTPLFSLCTVSPVQPGNTVLRRGRNSWAVRSYHYDVSIPALASNPPPTIADFTSPRGSNPEVFIRYQPTEYDALNQFGSLSQSLSSALRLPAVEYPQFTSDWVMHLFSATIIVNPQLPSSTISALNSTNVSLSSIFALSGSNPNAVLYLNGNPININTVVNKGSVAYNAVLPLQAGSNFVQIVTNNYVNLGGGAFEFGTTLFSSLAAYGGDVMWYADSGPMTEVSLFELQYQTARNDFSRYAITTSPTTGQTVVVVRELPTTVYDLTSSALPTNGPTSLIVQANLSSTIPNLTPRIYGYTVEVS